VIRQSERVPLYRAALEKLQQQARAYRCTCSRSEEPGIYSGHCRRHPPPAGPAAWRFAMAEGDCVQFDDRIQGSCRYAAASLGDPVIFRRDGIAAYQLAVVVDDAAQGITHVVRGADLLDSTAWQLRIGAALDLPAPAYAHVPVITEPDGSKLAKSRSAPAIEELPPAQALATALGLLGYTVPPELGDAAPARMLDWAVPGWPPAPLRGRPSTRLPTESPALGLQARL
jgi:glutamyl-Q tRNA(Asp) synthetase